MASRQSEVVSKLYQSWLTIPALQPEWSMADQRDMIEGWNVLTTEPTTREAKTRRRSIDATTALLPERPFSASRDSDYPRITPERWMKDFEEAGFRPEVMPAILKGNTIRLLGLDKQ